MPAAPIQNFGISVETKTRMRMQRRVRSAEKPALRIEVTVEVDAKDRAVGEAVVAATGEDILVLAQMAVVKFRTTANPVRIPRGCTEKEGVKVGILGRGGGEEVAVTVEWCITGTEEDRLAVETEAVNAWRTLWIEGTDEDGVVRLMEEDPLSLMFAIIPMTIKRTREEIGAHLAGLVEDGVTVQIMLNQDKTG